MGSGSALALDADSSIPLLVQVELFEDMGAQFSPEDKDVVTTNASDAVGVVQESLGDAANEFINNDSN